MSLTFEQVHRTNRARCQRWHPGFADHPYGEDVSRPRQLWRWVRLHLGLDAEDEWSGADWSNAMCGEAGELANVVKKLRRIEGQFQDARRYARADLLVELADECADVILYLDLLATYYGIDLPNAIRHKFNLVSKREGFPERL